MNEDFPGSPFEEFQLDPVMFDLFRADIEAHCKELTQGLLEVEKRPKEPGLYTSLMRAAHSIKGAARIVHLDPIVRLAHTLEDCLSQAEKMQSEIPPQKMDLFLGCADFFSFMAKMEISEIREKVFSRLPMIESMIKNLRSAFLTDQIDASQRENKNAPQGDPFEPAEFASEQNRNVVENLKKSKDPDRVLRITAANLSRLMGLAGESLIEARRLHPFEDNLLEFKHQLSHIEKQMNFFRKVLGKGDLNPDAHKCLAEIDRKLHELHLQLSEKLIGFDDFIQRHALLSDQLYQEVVGSRLRPFADGIEPFPRLIRDLAHQLGKQARLQIEGESTLVDREILEKLESPLNHLLRNAIDHGIETPQDRLAAGKPVEGVIKLQARHVEGMLLISVSDDGCGIDVDHIRRKIIEKKLTAPEIVEKMDESELIDYLLLPDFSTSERLTEISGRGVGLNAVQNAVHEAGGHVRIRSRKGQGMIIDLRLPLTRCVMQALIVNIAGEPYAFPLARIDHVIELPSERIEKVENRRFFQSGKNYIPLISASELLGLEGAKEIREERIVILLSHRSNQYGLEVDAILGEKELVVKELDPRLGKIPYISACAIMDDGSPILIMDCDDIRDQNVRN